MTIPLVVISPFANERIREWPLQNFQRLIERCQADGYNVAVCGTRAQRPLANSLVRPFSSEHVQNLCGTTDWSGTTALLRRAAFVVANNSGIAHLAASMDKWVLCLFAGSHHWLEWMPYGRRVVTVARMPACAPCCSHVCPNHHDCMANLDADLAYSAIALALSDRDRIRQID